MNDQCRSCPDCGANLDPEEKCDCQIMDNRGFGIGDEVVNYKSGFIGKVLEFYNPKVGDELTRVDIGAGHTCQSPTKEWRKLFTYVDRIYEEGSMPSESLDQILQVSKTQERWAVCNACRAEELANLMVGLSVDRMIDICTAEKENRLVILHDWQKAYVSGESDYMMPGRNTD